MFSSNVDCCLKCISISSGVIMLGMVIQLCLGRKLHYYELGAGTSRNPYIIRESPNFTCPVFTDSKNIIVYPPQRLVKILSPPPFEVKVEKALNSSRPKMVSYKIFVSILSGPVQNPP